MSRTDEDLAGLTGYDLACIVVSLAVALVVAAPLVVVQIAWEKAKGKVRA